MRCGGADSSLRPPCRATSATRMSIVVFSTPSFWYVRWLIVPLTVTDWPFFRYCERLSARFPKSWHAHQIVGFSRPCESAMLKFRTGSPFGSDRSSASLPSCPAIVIELILVLLVGWVGFLKILNDLREILTGMAYLLNHFALFFSVAFY